MLATLLACGLGQAAYGGFMVLTGEEYGWLEKKVHYLGSATGTFVNRNHLAGYLELTAAAGLALVLIDIQGWQRFSGWRGFADRLLDTLMSPRLLARAALLVIALGLVLTRSRMGNISFFSALSIGGLLYSVLRWRRDFWPALFLFLSILVVDVLIVSSQFGLERVIERIDATRSDNELRATLFTELEPVAQAFAMTGSGLGTFQLAYAPSQSEALPGLYDHAHNDYLQFLIEAGVVGAGLIGLLVGLHLLKAIRVILFRGDRRAVGVCAGAAIGLFSIAIHSTADFNLQIPANAAIVVVLLGLIGGRSPRSSQRRGSLPAPVSEGNDGANLQAA